MFGRILGPNMKQNLTVQFELGPGRLALLVLACLALGMLVPPGRSLQTQVPAGQTSIPSTYQLPAGVSADSNSQMIAVTGVDRTGASVLYLIDTENKQLAVYQATGGTSSKMGLRLVGARRLDLDLELVGYNDQSDYSYRELQKQFSDLASADE